MPDNFIPQLIIKIFSSITAITWAMSVIKKTHRYFKLNFFSLNLKLALMKNNTRDLQYRKKGKYYIILIKLGTRFSDLFKPKMNWRPNR